MQPSSPSHISTARSVPLREHIIQSCLALGYDDALAAAWADDAIAAGAPFPQPSPWWFDPQAAQDLLRQLHFSDTARNVLLEAIARIRTQAPQWAVYAQAAGAIYMHADAALRTQAIKRPAPPEEKWQELSRLHRAIVYLHLLPGMVQRHEKLSISKQVTIDTARDFSDRIHIHQKMHGCTGLHDQGWFANHLRLELFTLGRLQFAPSRLISRFIALRNKNDDVKLMLLEGLAMRSDGQFATAAPESSPTESSPESHTDTWTTTFQETDTHWQGHLLDDMGCAQRQPSALDKTRWQRVLQPDDSTLVIHIPEGQPLSPAACLDSFEQARTFFPTHLAFNFKAATCVSWLMDPQLTQVLPPKANLAAFIRLFHPYPVNHASDKQMFERVFGGPVQDLDKAPRDTSLQAIILDEIKRGRHWRTAGGVRLVQSIATASEAKA